MNQQETASREIIPITMPGVHSRVYSYLKKHILSGDTRHILDVGAGHGAFSRRLHEDGFHVSACDFNPDHFYLDGVECKYADITRELPYGDETFDVVVLIEVMEHIHDHATIFKECHRVLKKSGIMFFSTPNIMSLKSRIRFLYTGFFYAFKPLDYHSQDGMQHIASLSIDQYSYLSATTGFSTTRISIDRKQKSSRWLSVFIPLIWLTCKAKGIPFRLHNRHDYLMGRLLFFTLTK